MGTEKPRSTVFAIVAESWISLTILTFFLLRVAGSHLFEGLFSGLWSH
jgi:hypothetical protein